MRKIILIFNSSHWEKEPLMCISAALSLREEKQFPDTERWGDQCDTLGNTQIRRPLWERTAFSRTNCPYPSDIPANGSANGSSPREKFLGTSENTRMKLRWVEEVGPQPESRAIANAKWLRDNFCLSSGQSPTMYSSNATTVKRRRASERILFFTTRWFCFANLINRWSYYFYVYFRTLQSSPSCSWLSYFARWIPWLFLRSFTRFPLICIILFCISW